MDQLFIKEEDTGQPPPYPEAVLVMDIVGNMDLIRRDRQIRKPVKMSDFESTRNVKISRPDLEFLSTQLFPKNVQKSSQFILNN